MLETFSYYSANENCIRPIQHLVSLRDVAAMSTRKNERGIRRAVKRADASNALLQSYQSIYSVFLYASGHYTRDRQRWLSEQGLIVD